MRILYITPYFPYPPNSGGTLSIYQRITALYNNDCNIDFFSLTNRSITADDLSHCQNKTNKCTVFNRKSNFSFIKATIKAIFYKKSIFLSLIPESFSKTIQHALANNNYDLIICEHSFMGQWFLNKFPTQKKLMITVINNIEYDWYYYMYKNQAISFKKLYFFLEQRALKEIEEEIFTSSTRFWFLNGFELAKIHIKYFIEERSNIIPLLPIDLVNNRIFENYHSRGPIITFVSRLDSPRNVKALQYFLVQIFPIIRDVVPSVVFKVVGIGANQELIKELLSISNVLYVGPVENISDIYQSSKIIVIPMLESIGAQTKLFEAIREMSIVVCTPHAVKGTLFEKESAVVVAEGAQVFAEKCIEILQGIFNVDEIFLSIKDLENRYSSHAIFQLVQQCISNVKEN